MIKSFLFKYEDKILNTENTHKSWVVEASFPQLQNQKNREAVSLKKLAGKYSHFSDLWVYLRDHESIINVEK